MSDTEKPVKKKRRKPGDPPRPIGLAEKKADGPAPAWFVPWEDSTASQLFERFAFKNKYDRGDSDLSITQLINPPRVVALEKVHADALKQEESTSILSILGSAVHKILEDGAGENHVTERRIFTVIDGVKISGQMDLIVKVVSEGVVDIEDYKVTSMYSVSNGPTPSWEKQLNGYAGLLRMALGVKVRNLRVHAVLRDYSKARAPSWMTRPVVTLDIPRWTDDGQEVYLRQQVKRHKDAQAKLLAGDTGIPECSPYDTWDSPAAIHYYTETLNDYVMDRPIRCQNYCAVADHCDQYGAFKIGFNLSAELARQEAAKPAGQGQNP